MLSLDHKAFSALNADRIAQCPQVPVDLESRDRGRQLRLYLAYSNVVHRHFPWSRFVARHTVAVEQNAACEFPALITESDDDRLYANDKNESAHWPAWWGS